MALARARPIYPRFSPIHNATLAPLKASRNFSTLPRRLQFNDHARQKLIHEIRHNPNILTSSSASITTGKTSWLRKLTIFASSCCVFMGVYLGIQTYTVYHSKESDSEPRTVFFPIWLGVNWPSQRHFKFPQYLRYLDPDHHALVEDGRDYVDSVQREHVERQVLDCLFRSAVVREIFKLPISVKATPTDSFDLWIEPKYCTFHGPLFSIGKKDGHIYVNTDWRIKSVKLLTDIDDIVSGLTSEFESLAKAEAQRNTHDKSSGRVHQANVEKEPDLRPLESSSVKSQVYHIAFKGTLGVNDLSKQHAGSVAYTGIIDNSHIGLNGGVRIVSMTLEVSEYGRPSTLYKIK